MLILSVDNGGDITLNWFWWPIIHWRRKSIIVLIGWRMLLVPSII